MILLMAIITNSKKLSAIISDMSAAVKSGDLEKFQINADLAISKIGKKNFIEISEDDWENILANVRKNNPGFQSNFVLEEHQIEELLEIQKLPQAFAEMLLLAKKEKKLILQILQDNEN